MTTDSVDTQRNLAAKFLPMDPDDDTTLPCVEIAGVQVYVYFDNGTLTISGDFDTAEQVTTPVRVTMSGKTVFTAR